MTKELLVHALKVTSHWVAATLLAGLVILIHNNPEITQQFTHSLIGFGIPVYLANIVTAVGVKFLESRP